MKSILETRDSAGTRWEYKPVEKVDSEFDGSSDIDELAPVRISISILKQHG